MELAIYVDQGCPGCERARHLAGEIGRLHMALEVRVVELADVPEVPESVVAVPAYVLDGKLVSLGNPYLKDIEALIERGLAEKAGPHGAE